jgi:RNA polymerase sigma factor (TIGR02999 family)
VQITRLLQRLEIGEGEVMHDLMPLVYDELKKLARGRLRREAGPIPLGTTALVHEAFLKLSAGRHPSYENRSHFYGIVSRLMRQILVDTARSRAAEKRGAAREIAVGELPDWIPQADRSVLSMNDALQQLEKVDPFKAQIIEMTYFGGLTAEESSMALSTPIHIVRRELRLAKAWLRKEMEGDSAAMEVSHQSAES